MVDGNPAPSPTGPTQRDHRCNGAHSGSWTLINHNPACIAPARAECLSGGVDPSWSSLPVAPRPGLQKPVIVFGTEERFVVGRASQCDMVLYNTRSHDIQKCVSRTHFVLTNRPTEDSIRSETCNPAFKLITRLASPYSTGICWSFPRIMAPLGRSSSTPEAYFPAELVVGVVQKPQSTRTPGSRACGSRAAPGARP